MKELDVSRILWAFAALSRQGHMQVQPHADTSHVHKHAFPLGYQAHAWRKWTPGAHIIDILNVMLACVILPYVKREKKHSQLFFCSLSAGKENRWAAIDSIAWQTALFLLDATVWYVSGNQWCHNSAIKWWLCLSDNCLTAQCQAGSII